MFLQKVNGRGCAIVVQNCLGSYRLLKVIHAGQARQLWQAYDDGRQRMIAIKAVLPKAAKDSEQVGYLRQEFKVGQEIKHPRIIEVYNFDIDRGTPFLAMEWFPAPNLKKQIRTKEDREKTLPVSPHDRGAGGGRTGMDAQQGLGPSGYQAREFPGK